MWLWFWFVFEYVLIDEWNDCRRWHWRVRNNWLVCVLCDSCSAQGEVCGELTAPTPPPRRLRLGLAPGCMNQALVAPVHVGQPSRTRSFSRIASGLKIAQAQAMAVAGFLPEWRPPVTDANGNSSAGMHVPCSIFNHRASFHGRGQPPCLHFSHRRSTH